VRELTPAQLDAATIGELHRISIETGLSIDSIKAMAHANRPSTREDADRLADLYEKLTGGKPVG